uniref:Ubiquitin carboxyl-terminal hydrolase n=1 Tax=Amphora coffeiformis TaxID=265554 RepID=A0A7S3L4I9_9STRA|mmetsp:Transcript_10185/g.19635  ORF Transcript_10185/g.19635 Transcript_10185/m.19635 type:complete len:525 (+) Transcript_10185:110-1684(+)|eukprot:scaffold34688_cov234-Amphora_coffeaeformis.AAC.7
MVSLQVKWGKQTLDLQYDPATGYKGLVNELSEKTSVPIERMKVMAKTKGLWKGVLKEDTAIDWSSVSASPVQLLLMGSAAKLTGPAKPVVFLEDLPAEQVAKVVDPAGLQNLGNTCYMNSVVQCLRVVDPLRKGLQAYQSSRPSGGNSANLNNMSTPLLISSLQKTWEQLDRQTTALNPVPLVQATKMAYPQFDQRGPQGQPMQQDAEEFYSNLMTTLATESRHLVDKGLPDVSPDSLLGATNLIDAVFGMRLEETLTCTEVDSEPPVTTTDLARKLVCSIQGGSDARSVTNVSHVAEGIALSLEEGNIEKHSDVLGRNALWKRTQRISRLPPILVVQFGRFYWKATPDSQDHPNGVKCKVMKPVAFTTTLDVYEFCNEAIQKVLKKHRDAAIKAEEERLFAKDAKAKEGEGDAEMKDASQTEEDPDLQAALALSMQTDDPESDKPVGPGLPSGFQGLYELFGVVTHKGRDADGGHYMAWVKHKEGWYVFDDDEVTACDEEDVMKLKGGGDWHMSYINFYRASK